MIPHWVRVLEEWEMDPNEAITYYLHSLDPEPHCWHWHKKTGEKLCCICIQLACLCVQKKGTCDTHNPGNHAVAQEVSS